MPQRDFNAAITRAKEQLDGDMPASADRRLRARLNGESPARPRIRWLRLGLASALTAGLVLASVQALSKRAPEAVGGFAIVAPSPDFAAEGDGQGLVLVTSGRSTLRDEQLGSSVTVEGPSTLQRQADGVLLVAGKLELDVDHTRARAAPYRVQVSHGSIEVLGTRFTVTQRAGGGEVTLHQGSIRFRASDGQVRVLTPGEALAWPLPALARAPEPTPPTPEPQPVPLPTPKPVKQPIAAPVVKDPVTQPTTAMTEKSFDPEELLNQIATLRSRGQYEEAVTALTSALREGHAASTNERLSFELGAILTRQLRDAPRACAHWRRHVAQYPQGRYDREVTQARQQLACDREP